MNLRCKLWRDSRSPEKLEHDRKIARERARAWKMNNPLFVWSNRQLINKEKARKRSRIYKSRHKGKITADTQRRNATKLRATPQWADHDRIEKIYKFASVLSRITGTSYEVDHIIPLRNEIICGLHCHTNLQILTARENRMKGNRIL